MARNSDANLTRTQLIEQAYRKIGMLQGGHLQPDQRSNGIRVLNMLIREEDETARSQLWAVAEHSIPLTADRAVYRVGRAVGPLMEHGLADDVIDVVSVWFRDTGGDDTPCELIGAQPWAELADKTATGDTTHVFFRQHRNRATQEFWIYPVPNSVGTASVVVGTNGKLYTCIKAHTSSTDNKPTTGADWFLYWVQSGTALQAVWTADTAYTNRKTLCYRYKRSLLDFDEQTDNPDMPSGWVRYLTWRLAHDLAPEYALALDERAWLRQQWLESREELFPGTRPQVTDHHHKGLFY